MKTLLGLGLIILGVVSFFRYLSNYGFTSIYEFIGVLIGLAIFCSSRNTIIKEQC